MEQNMEGGCTCQRVRYRLIGTPLIVHACHCRWCQRETGTAHALNALYEADRLVHTAAEPEIVATPSASGKGQKIARCPSCRVAVRSNYPQAGSAIRFVRVGTMYRVVGRAIETDNFNAAIVADVDGRAATERFEQQIVVARNVV
jgi:hypothetical protein